MAGVPHGVSEARVIGGLRMATILEFKSAPKPTDVSAIAAYGAASAEIVFFPGIRYERHTGEAGAEPSKPKRGPEEPEFES